MVNWVRFAEFAGSSNESYITESARHQSMATKILFLVAAYTI
jgi:hypothetical protein